MSSSCQAMGEKKEKKEKSGRTTKKDDGRKERDRGRRGRSRERRSSGRDRRRGDEESGDDRRRAEKKTRHGETSVVLTPPTRSRERDSGANRGVTEVSLSESAESEESQDEDESVQPASSRTAASEPKEAEASKPEGHKNAPPVPPAPSRLSGSEPPPEPKDPPKGKPGPRTKPKGKVGNDADKCSSYKCEICKRTVGGGPAGSFQHCRSPYHLSTWVWYQNKESRPWSDCQKDGDRWSKMLWAEGGTGPRGSAWPEGHPRKKQQKQWSPPPFGRLTRLRSPTRTKVRTAVGQMIPQHPLLGGTICFCRCGWRQCVRPKGPNASQISHGPRPRLILGESAA